MVLRMACCNFSTNKRVKDATWRLVTILPPPGGQGKMTGYTIPTMSGSDKRTNEFTLTNFNKECLSSVEHRRGRCYLSPDHSHKPLLYRTSSCTLTVVHTTALDI